MNKKTQLLFFVAAPFFIGISFYFLKVPKLIRNHAPDFLWAFALSYSLLIIWRRINFFWMGLMLASFISFELLQKYKIINGTFDFYDIIFYFVASIFSILIFKHYE